MSMMIPVYSQFKQLIPDAACSLVLLQEYSYLLLVKDHL